MIKYHCDSIFLFQLDLKFSAPVRSVLNSEHIRDNLIKYQLCWGRKWLISCHYHKYHGRVLKGMINGNIRNDNESTRCPTRKYICKHYPLGRKLLVNKMTDSSTDGKLKIKKRIKSYWIRVVASNTNCCSQRVWFHFDSSTLNFELSPI